jgi:HlyD family secretion protein
MKRWSIRLLVLALLAGAGYVAKITVLAPKPVEVSVHVVERGAVESTVTNTRAGTIAVRRRAQLSPEVGGRVVELPFSEGDRVEQGDLLLRLDQRIALAERALAESRVRSAQAAHAESCLVAERAERELVRNRSLAASKIISEDLLDGFVNSRDRALLACTSASTRVEVAQAELALVDARLAQSELRAPFSGVLAQLQVELGEYTTPSPPGVPIPSVIDLIDPSSVYVVAPMDEVDTAVIQVGQAVRVTIDPYPEREFSGRVTRVAPYVLDLKEQNRTLDVEVELDDLELAARLLPGTSADVEVILRVAADALRIPTSALLEGGRVLLFEGGPLKERELQVGLRNWNWTEVRGGLVQGERVVTSLGSTDVKAGVEAVLADSAD